MTSSEDIINRHDNEIKLEQNIIRLLKYQIVLVDNNIQIEDLNKGHNDRDKYDYDKCSKLPKLSPDYILTCVALIIYYLSKNILVIFIKLFKDLFFELIESSSPELTAQSKIIVSKYFDKIINLISEINICGCMK